MFLPLLLLYFSAFVSSKWLCFCTSTSCSIVILSVSRRFVQLSSSHSLLWRQFLVISCSNLFASKNCFFIGDEGPIFSELSFGWFHIRSGSSVTAKHSKEEACSCFLGFTSSIYHRRLLVFYSLTSFLCNCYFVPLRWLADGNSGDRGQVFICVAVFCLSREWGIIVVYF